jgi:transposase
MQGDCLTELLGFQGYQVTALEMFGKKPGLSGVRVQLARTRKGYVCGGCGRAVAEGYDHEMHEVHHLRIWHHHTVVRFPRFRVNCPACGIRTEALAFVTVRGPHVTHSLAALVHELCKVMTVKAAALFAALHPGTVKAIDRQVLEEVQATRSLDGITVLGMDEISVGKGHHYWTLVSALEGPRGPEMLQVVEGRTERRLKRFWRWFGEERAGLITHAVIDMCRAFENSIRAHCRKKVGRVVTVTAQIIYDKFHVVRHLQEALNTVRKAELRRSLGRFKKTLSGKKFVLLARHARVRGHAREALDAILAASPRLQKAYWLKESFGHLWSYRSRTWALKFWRDWVAQLRWSRLPSYRRFVRLVERHMDGILAYCDKRVSLGYIESANLKARNVIRRAYGYRDQGYMKLKIIQVCTPWMNEFRPWRPPAYATHSISS